MKLTCSSTFDKRKSSDALVIPFWIEEGKVIAASSLATNLDFPNEPIMYQDFKGKSEEIAVVYSTSSKEKRVLFLGLGDKATITCETMRRSYAAAVRLARKKRWHTLSVIVPEIQEKSILSAFEGAMLANYSYDQWKKRSLHQDPASVVASLQAIGLSSVLWEKIQRRQIVVDAVNFARDLVNSNADDVTPSQLSLLARELQSDHLHVQVLRKKELEKENMDLLLAVGKGARAEPALILLHYKGDPSSKEVVALVGKGITFDTGGLNLKISGSMETMKSDMAGAAAVLSVIRGAQKLGLQCNILAVLACAENAIGPDSYKPGDVIVGKGGISVEVNDTDAEGRLVLADAFSYVQEHYSPKAIIDLATLTGGVVVALGEEASGLFCNDDPLAYALLSCSERCSERLWRMPLYPEYKEGLKSLIADTKNAGGRKASACKGAVFLQQFIEKNTPWAHLDIAGTAYLSETKVYHPTLATGVGVRLLLSFLGAL